MGVVPPAATADTPKPAPESKRRGAGHPPRQPSRGEVLRAIRKAARLRLRFEDAVTILRSGDPGEYRVRSETGNGFYRVRRIGDDWSCECRAFREAGTTCKHVWAVRIPIEGIRSREWTGKSKPTYRQDWPAYDAAQQAEHLLFDPLLWSLLDGIPEPPRLPGKSGRNPIPLRTQLLLAIKKVHLGESTRRARGLIRVEYTGGKGLLDSVPNYAVPSRLFNRPDAGPLLLELIVRSALPLKALEDAGTVAIDSSGFCTTCMGAYCSEVHNPARKHRFLKAHVVIGVKTHVVMGVRITDEVGADTPQFVPLLRGVREAGFTPAAVVADAAYPSRANYGAAAELGMEAYLAFHSNASRSKSAAKGQPFGAEVYRKMLLYFQLHRDAFDRAYHKRSNVEATFSAIKRKLGENLLSRNPTARVNELLAKLLAYNLTVLVHEIHEHGIDPAAIGLPPPPKPKPTAEAVASRSTEDLEKDLAAALSSEFHRLAQSPEEPCDSSSTTVTESEGVQGPG